MNLYKQLPTSYFLSELDYGCYISDGMIPYVDNYIELTKDSDLSLANDYLLRLIYGRIPHLPHSTFLSHLHTILPNWYHSVNDFAPDISKVDFNFKRLGPEREYHYEIRHKNRISTIVSQYPLNPEINPIVVKTPNTTAVLYDKNHGCPNEISQVFDDSIAYILRNDISLTVDRLSACNASVAQYYVNTNHYITNEVFHIGDDVLYMQKIR